MSDYFDELEHALRDVVKRRAHLPWHARLRLLSLRHPALAVVLAALVVATPTVAAVGAVSGWFSQGAPDVYYPASASSGLGKVLPKDGVLLPIRVADPDGGPPWGMRLIHTTRGATCIQVGRVEDGQIGALGIDGAWSDDHLFHEIKPNDGLADICGATDAAGDGFVNQGAHGAPASVDVPLYNSGGGSPSRCRSPYASTVPAPLLHRGGKLPPALEETLKRVEQQRSRSTKCPASAMRMVFAGLLGPDANSITYDTPSGQTETEQTSGGVGAYLIVFRETAANCQDFTRTALGGGGAGCQSDGTGNGSDLQGPTAVTSVTYDSGKTCSVDPPAGLVSAYAAFNKKMDARFRKEPGSEVRAQVNRFFAEHGVEGKNWIQALMPECKPVGWVAPKGPKLTAGSVASPLKVTVSEGRRFCSKGRWSALSVQDNTVTCDHRIPKGDKAYWESSAGASGPLFALVRISFTARQPVTTANSFYQWQIQEPGNHGSDSNRTQANVRRGERVTFTMSEAIPGTGGGSEAPRGIYHGTISFTPNVGQAGPETGGYNPGRDGSLIVGHFSFKLPLHH